MKTWLNNFLVLQLWGSALFSFLWGTFASDAHTCCIIFNGKSQQIRAVSLIALNGQSPPIWFLDTAIRIHDFIYSIRKWRKFSTSLLMETEHEGWKSTRIEINLLSFPFLRRSITTFWVHGIHLNFFHVTVLEAWLRWFTRKPPVWIQTANHIQRGDCQSGAKSRKRN